ncbi:MAG: hypothetical protein CMI29_08515 [Opitutae bacterium]|nr:hypothetical protein [Opitutae bacterium]
MGRGKNARRKAPAKPSPRRPRFGESQSSRSAPVGEACVACDAAQVNKFDSTLMCEFGHPTCFACVAAGVQPHALCGHACNGFKYRCSECNVWLCINRTQELALLCGGHALAHSRLRNENIAPQTFESADAYYLPPCAHRSGCEGQESEDDDSEYTYSSSSSDYCGDCACAHGRKGVEAQLPRICLVDWTVGQEQRARRLARLRSALLGKNRA